MNQELHGEYKSFSTEVESPLGRAPQDMLVVPDSSKEPPMLVNLHMLDTPGAGGKLVKPPRAKGKGKN